MQNNQTKEGCEELNTLATEIGKLTYQLANDKARGLKGTALIVALDSLKNQFNLKLNLLIHQAE